MEVRMKASGIGGQAVIEGVMMRNKDQYAVAVRKPDKEIEIKKDNTNSLKDKNKFTKFPVIRGILAFIDSLRLGMGTLTYSANFIEEEEEKQTKEELTEEQLKKKEAKESLVMGVTIVAAVMVAIGIYSFKRTKNVNDFILGGRKIGSWLT